MVREYTNKLRDALDEGLITADAVVDMALAYMSEDDVKDMCLANDFFVEEEDGEENFYVIGDVGMDSETHLYESTDYAEALHWVTNYINDGTYGGYKHIELGYFNGNNDWIYLDFYSPEGEDHA